MIIEEEIEKNLKDDRGNYFVLEPTTSDNDEPISVDDFVPDNIVRPDAKRYLVISYDSQKRQYQLCHIDNEELKDAVVKRLKKIHGIVDPWDDDPDYFNNKLRKNTDI